MADLVTTPHFAAPFRMHGSGVAVVEQDTPEEIFQSATMVLRYEQGQRLGLPDFGLPDQALLMGGANLDLISTIVQEADERVSALAEREVADLVTQAVDTVRVTLGVRTDG